MRSQQLRGVPQPAVGERDCGTLVPRHPFFQLRIPGVALPVSCHGAALSRHGKKARRLHKLPVLVAARRGARSVARDGRGSLPMHPGVVILVPVLPADDTDG